MSRSINIALETLTEDAFVPYGKIIDEQSTTPNFKAPHINAWRVDFAVDGPDQFLFAGYRAHARRSGVGRKRWSDPLSRVITEAEA